MQIPNRTINRKYYDLLEKICKQPFDKQQKSIEDFIDDYPNFESAYHELFDLFIYYGKINEAKNYFHQLAKIPNYRRNSYWVISKIYEFQQYHENALETYKKALFAEPISFDLINNFINFSQTHFNRINISDFSNIQLNQEEKTIVSGLILFSKNHYNEALADFEKLSEQVKQNEKILNITGLCYFYSRNFSKAELYFQKALKMSQQNNDFGAEARLLMNLGLISGYNKLNEKMLGYLNTAYQIANKINDFYLIQYISRNLGFFYKNNNDFDAAKNKFREAFKIAKQFRKYKEAAKYGYYLAQLLFNLRDFNEAIAAYDESEKFAGLARDPTLLFRFKISKGDIYFYLNQNDLAQQIFQEALDVAKSKNLSRQEHIANVRLANVFVRKGDYFKSRLAYQKYVNYIDEKKLHQRESKAYWLWKLAQTYLSEKRYRKAKEFFMKAMRSAKKYNKKSDYEWSILRLAELNEKTGNYTEALSLYGEILAIAKEDSNTSELSEIYQGMGNIYKKQDYYNKAITYYMLAADIIEKTRRDLQIDQFKIGYFRDEYRVYKNLVQCYLQQYLNNKNQVFLDSLFYYDQMARGRSLQELKLKKKSAKDLESKSFVYQQYLKANLNLRKRQRELRLQTNISSTDELNGKLTQIEADKYSLIEQRLRLVDKNKINKINTKDSIICSLSIARNNLKKEGIGLLLYNISNDISFALATNDSAIKIVTLNTTADSFKTLIDSLMAPFHNVNQDSISQIVFHAAISHRLYKLLIEPVEEIIHLPQKILVVADHELLNLPFEMLLFSKPKALKYTPVDAPDYQNYFLLQKYSFSYAPSSSFLKKIPKPLDGSSRLLLIANPFQKIVLPETINNRMSLFTGLQFSPLPNADIEANNIKYNVKHVEIFRHENATKSVFFEKAPKQQFIHLAAHGFVDLSFDAFSGIALAVGDDSTDDGLLLGYEISDLNLQKCDLITLSACETGRGKAVAGEGVLGLPRLFLAAGAKSVLMTLWNVDDKFTSELMPIFYKNLFEKKLSKTEALSQAKLEIFNKKENGVYYQHPFYWASFCMFGEPRGNQSYSFFTIKVMIIFSILISALFIALLSVKAIRSKKVIQKS